MRYIQDPSLIANRVEALREEYKVTGDAEEIARQLEEVKRKFANLYKLAEAATDDDTLDSLTIRLKELEKQKHQLMCMHTEIVEEDDIKQAIQVEITRFEEWTNKVRPYFADPTYEASYDDKVLAIRILGIRAKVYPATYPERFELEVAPPRILRIVNVGVHSPHSRPAGR